MRSVFRVLSLGSVIALACVAAADGFAIKRTPKAGAAVKYAMTCTIETIGGNGTLTATLVEKVTDVDKDGNYSVEQSQLDCTYTYGDEKKDMPKRTPITLTYKPSGQVTTITGALVDKPAYRMENLGAILDPGKTVNIGDIWEGLIKEDKTLETRNVHGEYKLLAEEKIGTIDTLKIKATLKETEGDLPATNELTVWISTVDGSIVQMESKWANMPFSGASMPISGTYKLAMIPTP